MEVKRRRSSTTAPSSSSSSYLFREPDGTSTKTTTSAISRTLNRLHLRPEQRDTCRVPHEGRGMRIPAELVSPARGHAHFWDRAAAAGVTRGQFLARTAGTVGAGAGFGLRAPAGAWAKKGSSNPKP